MRLLIPLLLFAFYGQSSHANWQWDVHCKAGLEAVVADRSQRGYFTDGQDLPALADKLRPTRDKPFYDAPLIPLKARDGKTFTVKLAKGNASGNRYFVLSDGKKEVCTLQFSHDEKENRIFLTHAETAKEYSGKSASDLVIKTLFLVHPEVKTVDGHLGWVNFKIIAEALAGGKNMSNMAMAEATVMAAMANQDKAAVVAAVERSPMGKQMVALGFKIDDKALIADSAEKTYGDGPILRVKWKKP